VISRTLVPPKEYRTKLELAAAHFRAGLLAYERGYDLQNVLSLSKVAQETYWKLRNGEED